jgi:RNA polymerase sigma factor (sigma-70 family)
MQEVADMELLRQYVQRNSDEAFATLVTRHVNLVYSAALRKTGDPNAAEEITQAVFIILAKKAGRLSPGTILSGWLYQAARLTSASFLRTEIRRARREQEAYMQSLANETEPELWPQMAPLLEDAMGRLGEKDRNAIALRFFEGKSFQEIGTAFGASEFRQFRSSRTAGAGKIRDRCCHRQRRGGQQFNLNPHQRSLETYGMDKSEDCHRQQRGRVAGGWSHDHCSPGTWEGQFSSIHSGGSL